MAKTGREFTIELARKYSGRDWFTMLADRACYTQDNVEWCLRQPERMPVDIEQAAEAMLGDDGETILDRAKPSDFG